MHCVNATGCIDYTVYPLDTIQPTFLLDLTRLLFEGIAKPISQIKPSPSLGILIF